MAYYVDYTASVDDIGDTLTLHAVCIDEIAGRNIIRDMANKHKKDAHYVGYSYSLILRKDDEVIYRETNAQ